ncbi:DUF2505 domain-containing protein [Brevibacterium sp.]|uniref:DUF2505 domain-containing protein n=1 Tax=Brevibacterium sp. TaxID=1701 RepID=UPI0028118E9A|nr:DUF2505 domain-containing protein [Brevibacterium sp.]
MRTLTLHRETSLDRSAFLARLSDAALWDSLGSRARLERLDADTRVEVTTPMSASDLPEALASRLPSSAELVEVYILPGDIVGASTEVRMTAHAAGVPVEIDALITLIDRDASGTGAGTAVDVRAEISSSVPLFGSMIESAVAPVLEKKLGQRLATFAA